MTIIKQALTSVVTLIIASVALAQASSTNSVDVKLTPLKVTHAGIFAATTYGTNEQDSNASHLSVGFGNADLHEVLNLFSNGSGEVPDFIYEATFRFSIVPFVLEDKTKKELGHKLDHIIAIKKQSAFAQMQPLVVKKVDSAIAPVPAGPAKDQLRSKLIADGEAALRQEISNQAEAIRSQKQAELDHRVEEIRTETMYQEFAIGFSKVIKDGHILAFVKGGKFKIETGPALDRNNQSELERYRAANSWVQEQVASTLALDAGIITRIDENTSVRYDLYLFHDRIPFLSGKEFIATAATLDQDKYEKHMKWAKIDSSLLRVLINKNFSKDSVIQGVQVYGSVGSYSGKFGGAVGLIAKINENNELILDYVKNGSDLKNVEEGVSAFLIRHITDGLTVSAGFEHLNAVKRSLVSDTSSNEQNLIAGLAYTFINHKILGLMVKSTVKGEVQWNLNKSSTRKDIEFLTNLTVDVLW